jgi:hypothetical protein
LLAQSLFSVHSTQSPAAQKEVLPLHATQLVPQWAATVHGVHAFEESQKSPAGQPPAHPPLLLVLVELELELLLVLVELELELLLVLVVLLLVLVVLELELLLVLVVLELLVLATLELLLVLVVPLVAPPAAVWLVPPAPPALEGALWQTPAVQT